MQRPSTHCEGRTSWPRPRPSHTSILGRLFSSLLLISQSCTYLLVYLPTKNLLAASIVEHKTITQLYINSKGINYEKSWLLAHINKLYFEMISTLITLNTGVKCPNVVQWCDTLVALNNYENRIIHSTNKLYFETYQHINLAKYLCEVSL